MWRKQKLKALSIVWKRLWQPRTARPPRPHMETHLGLVNSGKTGVPEECVLVFGPGLFDFPSTPFNCHFLDWEMDGRWVKSDRSSVSTASHHPLTHFWTKLTHSGPNSPTGPSETNVLIGNLRIDYDLAVT